MDPIDLDLDDLRSLAQDHLAPIVAQLLDALDEDDVTTARQLASNIEDAAQAIRYGRVTSS